MTTPEPPISLNTFLCAFVTMRTGCTWFEAIEAVASTAIEHPEWPDLQERRTWEEWEQWNIEK